MRMGRTYGQPQNGGIKKIKDCGTAPGCKGGNMGGKRKLEGQALGDPKRRNTQSQWGTQPIAQQPLDQGYGYDYNSSYNEGWASDSYGGQWK